MDGDAQPRSNEEFVSEFIEGLQRRSAFRRRCSRRQMHRLQRRPADPVPSPAQLHVRTPLDAAEGQGGSNIMDIDAAEDLVACAAAGRRAH